MLGFSDKEVPESKTNSGRNLPQLIQAFFEACVPSNRRYLWASICFAAFYLLMFVADKRTLPLPLAIIEFILPTKMSGILFWAPALYFGAKHFSAKRESASSTKWLPGWLGFFIYGMPLYIWLYWGFAASHPDIAANWDRLGLVPLYRLGLVWMMFGYSLRTIAPMFGLRMAYARSNVSPAFWQSYFAVIAIYSVCEILIFKVAVSTVITANPASAETTTNAVRLIVKENTSSICMSLIWFLYWRTSKTVREIFGSPTAALKEAAPAI